MLLQGKKIIVGITGSIAAYKIPAFIRILIKEGAVIKVITTPSAENFVTTLTLTTVSKNEVWSDIADGSNWNNHVELGLWADAFIIAPCSANTLAKLANGICDNLLCAVYLSARCPIFIAPAMDVDMWKHQATKANLERLKGFNVNIIPVEKGELASGLVGEGRMAEPENMVQFLISFFNTEKDLGGIRALVTAGPTFERLDPVRFIGNFSTGKMGIALAENLAKRGAEVLLILGPTHLSANNILIKTIRVESAAEMFEQVVNNFENTGIAILSAAVADFKPQERKVEKIKKSGDELIIKLTTTKDILLELGKIKLAHQTLVGFALETENEFANAENKLKRKNADIIVLNSLKDEGAGFGGDTNKITLFTKNGETKNFPLKSKKEIAEIIINEIIAYRNAKQMV